MLGAEKWIGPLINRVDHRQDAPIKASEGENGDPQKTALDLIAKSTPSATVDEHAAGSARALVAVTMGSDSDLPILKPGLEVLNDLGIPYFVTITSAHRTPERMFKFAREAVPNGFKVIIAGAGGAAHLPGMIAASTTLPVIGVPIKTSSLEGLDSLLSIVQMPVSSLPPLPT